MIRAARGVIAARVERREARAIAASAREAAPGRITAHLGDEATAGRFAAAKRHTLKRWRWLLRHRPGAVESLYATHPALAVRMEVRDVGTIGEQVERDLGEALAVDYSLSTNRRNSRHLCQASNVHRVLRSRRGKLIVMRDYTSWGSRGDDGYDTRRGVAFRSFLVVRDSTTGEAHVMRVPPKYGSGETHYESRIRGGVTLPSGRTLRGDEAVVHAAAAWTFELRPEQYEPRKQA